MKFRITATSCDCWGDEAPEKLKERRTIMIYGREKAKVPVTVINTPIMPKVGMEDDGKWHYVHNELVDWIKEQDKRTEQQILKEITDWAKEHNIGTVYLIDEEFVKTALLNEIERRKEQ